MISYWKTIEGKMTAVDAMERGCWVDVVNPTPDEVAYLVDTLHLDEGFVRSSLDEEETSRIETEDDQTLIIIDAPSMRREEEGIIYSTLPIGIILTEEQIYTICSEEAPVLKDFSEGLVKNCKTQQKTRFLLTILLRVATRFHQYLKQIDKISGFIERQLHRSMKNKELIQLLDLQKSLVYFSTSLKADEITMEKIYRGRTIKLYEEDQDLLEDVLIEIKQAIEMSNIYSNILTGTMDAFASVISNNLNIVMKVLTSITILMAIPTMISGFYGMNVSDMPLPQFGFPLLLSVVAIAVAAFILHKKDML
ncbi:magnesium transporter CorA family protein [Feifania hominis]|uniref:Magnesium transporter CorA family protein n=1 Tax=Feifania hominis TaxID=2763660 RepID=A0A926DCB0_9FIRM|nr:magnesium transporter CorA family protein [Feifania hominis]MBC8535194.1 magnesium transporter CorA family protein [Feifania hominis]